MSKLEPLRKVTGIKHSKGKHTHGTTIRQAGSFYHNDYDHGKLKPHYNGRS